jgi:hypothetical protein
VAYYERAFQAIVEHRVGAGDDADGVIQLLVGGARFWVSGASDPLLAPVSSVLIRMNQRYSCSRKLCRKGEPMRLVVRVAYE